VIKELRKELWWKSRSESSYDSGYEEQWKIVKKNKAIPGTDRGGQYGCETSGFPHFLDNRLTDGGEFISLSHQPSKVPGTHFC
jgi:hypothetical protein